MAMCSWARWATSRWAPAAACWNRTRASVSWREWKSFMAASKAANCVRPGVAWGASALEAGLLVLRGSRGLVMRLSAVRECAALLFLSAMRTQDGYIRPRHGDATGVQPGCGWLSDSSLPEKIGGLFRRGRVNVKSGGPFEAGDLGQSWNNFDVPVVVGQRPFLDRRAVHDEIVGWPFQHLFELANGGTEDPGEVGQGGCVGILEMGFVALGQNPGFKGEARRIGREHGEAVGLTDQADAGCRLVADDVAEDAALLEIEKKFGGVHFFLDALGDDGKRDQLGMGMLERRARGVAIVLEEDDVAEATVLLEIVDAILERPEDLFDELVGHVAEGRAVVRPFDDDLVGADAVHLVVHALAPAVQLAFDTEDGEFIGHDAHTPTGLVAVPGGAVGQHVGRRFVSIPVIERADRSEERRVGKE